LGFTALHHPLQYRPLAEVLQLIEAMFEFLEAPRVAFLSGHSVQGAGLKFRGRGIVLGLSYFSESRTLTERCGSFFVSAKAAG
jgi:hypothetical protein